MLQIKLTKSPTDYASGQETLPPQNRSFLQSYAYGQMQARLGHEPLYIVMTDDSERVIHSCLAILFKAKRGRYIFLPYLTLPDNLLPQLIDFLKQIAKENRVDFLRISPLVDDSESARQDFAKLGFRDAPVHMMHPELLWLLDLSADESALLSGMRKNTRYAIKQAEKMSVQIESGDTEEMLNKFYEIHLETSKRQHFTPYPWSYLQAERNEFAPPGEFKIFLAKHEEKYISAAVILYHGNEAVYHHGASLSEYNKIPGSYLIQWEAIREAKRRGLPRYNFWGVVENAPRHPWAGLSFFKQGFGGQGRPLLHCQDLPLTPKYWINFVVETVRRVKRGY